MPESSISEDDLDAAYEDYVHSKPLPEEHEQGDAECHNCGEPWDEDEWEERKVTGNPAIPGESWYYTCPGCGHETFEVGW